ncbi:MAG: PLP-dependent cysteine synthase family protein, partial [Polaromonas sp.]
EYHRTGDASLTSAGSCIEGIGRPRVEASFIRTVIDRMIEVPDEDSLAAMQALSRLLGRKVGPSTGTNFIGCLKLGHEMLARGEQGSILSLLCDSGERYLPTYYDAQWVQSKVGDCAAAHQQMGLLMKPALAG